MEFETFAQFMKWVNQVVIRVTQMLGVEDFADAPWYDLYDDLNGDLSEEDVIETLECYDDIFARIVALKREDGSLYA